MGTKREDLFINTQKLKQLLRVVTNHWSWIGLLVERRTYFRSIRWSSTRGKFKPQQCCGQSRWSVLLALDRIVLFPSFSQHTVALFCSFFLDEVISTSISLALSSSLNLSFEDLDSTNQVQDLTAREKWQLLQICIVVESLDQQKLRFQTAISLLVVLCLL